MRKEILFSVISSYNEVDHRDHRFFPLFLSLILFSRSKWGGRILKNLKNEAPMGIKPHENLDPSFGEKFIAFIPAAETDLRFTFVVTFQSTWSFNEISGKLRVTRIVVVVAERPQFCTPSFIFLLSNVPRTTTVSHIYEDYSPLSCPTSSSIWILSFL